VQLTVLGSSAAYPGPRGACSGYLVEEEGTKFLIDCGTGVLNNLQQVASLQQVTAIVISHFHADHFFDLIPYRYALTRPPYRDIRPVLYLPPGGRKSLLKSVSAFNDAATFFSDHFQIEEYNPRAGIKMAHLCIEFAPVKHYIPTYAMAICGEERLAYSADSGPCDELADIAQGVDLFLCEATRYSGDDGEWGHLLASEAVGLAKRAGVKRLVLTHFWPDCDYSQNLEQASDAFGEALEIAEVLRTFVF
jgi:ribonuclease BN (tRNA processing enzyme)